jgi:TRAP-type C4-dicarboxylate transport system substrate-binding protein
VRVRSASLAASVPAIKVFGLPYLWRSQDSRWKTLQGEIGQILLKNMETAKLYGLCFYEAGARSFYNNRREIRTVADLQGLLIGVEKNPVLIDLVTSLGAIAIPMPITEVYDGITKGVIDGAEHDWLHYETRGHYEVAKYYTLDRHLHAIEILIASKIALDQKLTPEQLALIQQAARDTELYEINQWNAREDTAIQVVTSAGNVITDLTPEAYAGFVTAAQPLYRKYSGEHKLLIDAIFKAQE